MEILPTNFPRMLSGAMFIIHKLPEGISNPTPKPETANPIVNKGMHELKRVINALIKQHGKPDVIRIEMARDLEMNTTRYKENQKQQEKNKKDNEKAIDTYKDLNLGKYPSYADKIKYRLWLEQDHRCVYSGKQIQLNAVFTADVEIDHILPYKKSLDDSYMNKVLCFTTENRNKGDITPKDACGGDEEKWNQITQEIKEQRPPRIYDLMVRASLHPPTSPSLPLHQSLA